MENFWDFNVWGVLNLVAVLLISLLFATVLRRSIPWLRRTLIPTPVLAGLLLVLADWACRLISGEVLFDTAFFGGNGTATLEVITYHCLALGFIASAFRPSRGRLTRKRTEEIFNTGITTVATYLLQGVLGLAITIVAAKVVEGFPPAAGGVLPFGFGQGTGQAMNYGGILENGYGFAGGKSFGLTIAALGFVSASIGGVLHLNLLRKRGKISADALDRLAGAGEMRMAPVDRMNESIDKLTIQLALIFGAYFLAYGLMMLLGALLPGMKSVIFGFNFLFGVLTATGLKAVLNRLSRKKAKHREYLDHDLMTKAGNFFFDMMITAGIAAIRFRALQRFWGIALILGATGLVITYAYNRFVARELFPEYQEEQFLSMYGMLTGTASTGIILLREIDSDFRTPAADNLVYQNLPAIAFGFPMLLLTAVAPEKPVLIALILVVYFLIMNVILFRKKLFRRRKKTVPGAADKNTSGRV